MQNVYNGENNLCTNLVYIVYMLILVYTYVYVYVYACACVRACVHVCMYTLNNRIFLKYRISA